jgi:1-acyl-sn-glycerol-3-phosphate acyltransferase
MRHYLGIELTVEGLELVDPHQTYLIAPLHEGFADLLALPEIPLKMRYVARDELFQEWKLLGPFLRDTGQIEISPENGAKSYRQLLRHAGAVFAAGESLVIFPQGTILGIESDFSRGAFAVARYFKQPILPVVLTGSHRVWEFPYSPILRYNQRMSLRVLPPISVEEVLATPVEELRQKVQQKLKAVALSGEVVSPRHFVPARDGYWDGYTYRIDPNFPELAADVEKHRRSE